jgi:hypothetical protein
VAVLVVDRCRWMHGIEDRRSLSLVTPGSHGSDLGPKGNILNIANLKFYYYCEYNASR